jgi:hypothetical protein
MKAGALVHPGPFMLPGLLRTSQNTSSRTLVNKGIRKGRGNVAVTNPSPSKRW